MIKRVLFVVALLSAAVTISATPAAAEGTASVTGIITDESGSPMSGAQVVAWSQVGRRDYFTATSGPDGTYTLQVRPGEYLLTARAPGYSTTFHTGEVVPPQGDNIALADGEVVTKSIALKPLGAITGTVTGPDGLPLGGAIATARSVGVFSNWYPDDVEDEYFQGATTAQDGSFTISNLAGGEFSLTVSPAEGSNLAWEYYEDAYDELTSTHVVPVPLGDPAEPLSIQLEVGGTVSGTVTGPDGTPIEGTYVSVNTRAWQYGGAALTAADGTYVVQGLPPNDYIVNAQGVGDLVATYHPSTAAFADAVEIPVQLGELVTGIDVQLLSAVRFEATIFDDPVSPTPVDADVWGIANCAPPDVPEPSDRLCTNGGLVGYSNIELPGPGQVIATGVPPGIFNVGAFTLEYATEEFQASDDVLQVVLASGEVAKCTFFMTGTGSWCDVIPAEVPSDGDGVPDAEEDAVNPAGDGNGDGVRDAEQAHVTSVESASGDDGFVTLAAPSGAELTSVTVTDPADLPAPPGGDTIASSVLSYTLSGIDPGSTIDVDLFFTEPQAANSYLKLQAGAWVPLPASGFTIASPTHIVLHLTDGGIGDEDEQANGAIVDPGAPALRQYSFGGFQAPVDALPKVNEAKAGSVVPLKWRLVDADGTPVSDPGSFVSATFRPRACEGATYDAIEYTAPAAGLKYQGNGEWQLGWQTARSWSGCGDLEVRFSDGSTKRAAFKFH